MMKKLRNTLFYILACTVVLVGGITLARAAEFVPPSETSAFVTNYLIGETDVDAPFFEEILPLIRKNIKEYNKHTVTPFYDKFDVLNNPENFQGLGHTTYANINGKTVTAEALYRYENEGKCDPNVGLGIMIYQCIQYKIAHPEEDVEIWYANYRTSVTYSVCVIPESKYYGYGRVLFGTNYDEQGFVRLSYMLAEAARMGIKVTLVTQLNSYGRDQYDPTQSDNLKYKGIIDHEKYFTAASETDCYNKYAPGKKVSDFLYFGKVGWNVEDKTSDMQHVKGAAVSHYLATDGTEHGKTIYMGSSNLDDVDYRGANANNGSQSGVIISDHDELYRITKNYFQLMYDYRGQEDMFEFRKIVNQRNEEQLKLILSGKEHLIPEDEQIVYLGSKTDKVFELYFTPLGGSVDVWDTVMNPLCKYVDKLQYSEDYIEFIWNISGYSDCNLATTLNNVLDNAFSSNRNVNNKLAIACHSSDQYAALKDTLSDLNLGTEIGYRVIKDQGRVHAKDMFVSYVEDGERHNVSLLTSCNYYPIAYNYRANSFLVINETEKTGGNFYNILTDRSSFGLISKDLMASPANITLEPGQSYNLDVTYTGSKTLTWTSNKTSVATVKNGKITAVGKGSATITVTDGTHKYTVKVKVVDCVECVDADGLTCNIDEQYVFSEKLSKMPLTFEATFSVDADDLTKTVTLLGNDGLYDPSLVFSLTSSGQPRVVIRNVASNSKQYTYTFKNVNVATGEKVHLAIVMDFSKKKMHCYVDGALKQSVSIGSFTAYEQKHNFVVGGDLKNGNATYFPGIIDSVALWSDLRSASEVANDFSNGIDTSDKNLLVSYNLTRCDEHLVKDLSSNGNDLEHIALWLDKDEVEPVTDFEYSFAVIGDTQTMCENDPEAMEALYDWILENKDSQKIEYVIGLGDITDDSTDGEWETVNRIISKLNGVIPYVLTRGNHDDWDDFNRNLHNGYYETTVDGMMNSGKVSLTDPDQPGVIKTVNADGSVTIVTREEDTPEGGTVTGDLTNSYRYFNIQGTDYLIMTLDFAPSSKVLKWAESVIKAHPNHKVIVVTHAYMYRDGTTIDAGDCYPPSYYTGYTDAQDGDEMWEKCFSKYENVLMVLSGHDPWQHIVYRQDKGVNGNTVTQMLIDPQYVDRNIGATAMVAMFYFSDDGKTLTVRYYSVEKDCYGSELSQFTVHLDHDYETEIVKATPTKEGAILSKCSCGEIESSTPIAKPATFKLSTTEYTYSGSAKKPSVIVKDSNGKTLKLGTDYKVSYKNNINVGLATVTVTFIGDNYSGSKSLTFNICPKVTSSISISSQSSSAIKLKWNKVTGATGYGVYKYNESTKKWELVKTTTETSYAVKNLKAATTYKFKIKAYKTVGSTKIWGQATSSFSATTEPAKPTNIKVTAASSSAIKLSWSKVSGATGYRVYKYNTSTKKWEAIKTTTSASYKVENLKAGTKYKFRIKAYMKIGDKAYWSDATSTFETATKTKTPTLKVTSTTKGKANLTWTNVSGESGFQVYYSTKKDSGFKKVKNYSADTLKGTKSSLTSGKTYYFKVRTYKKTDSGVVYGSWSSVKSVKIK